MQLDALHTWLVLHTAFEGLEVIAQRMTQHCRANGLCHGWCVSQENHFHVLAVRIGFTRIPPRITAAIPSTKV